VRERQKSSGDIREPAYGPKAAPSSVPGPVFLSIPGWASGMCLNPSSSVSPTRSAPQEKWRSAVRERQTVTRRLHVTEASCRISSRFTRTILLRTYFDNLASRPPFGRLLDPALLNKLWPSRIRGKRSDALRVAKPAWLKAKTDS
jgi:hypothetical protein